MSVAEHYLSWLHAQILKREGERERDRQTNRQTERSFVCILGVAKTQRKCTFSKHLFFSGLKRFKKKKNGIKFFFFFKIPLDFTSNLESSCNK